MKVDKFSATALFAFFIFLKIASGQSLRGLVREAKTGDGLYSANVFLMEKSDSALVATTTDLSGGFQIKAPKPGIFSLKISQIGFETRIIPEVELNFGKETILEISLNEAPGELKSVEIRPDGSDGRLPMAGLHLLTRDQVLRYPATFFDPARLAQSLPGVSNDDQNNGISVRGLTPALFQYRIEGLEVVNPNHLSNAGTITDLPTANSGGVSMLSAQMLGNSAIYTGATPVGYGNSVGGLMDIRLRPGNNEHFEGTVQAGLVGLDASVEGPFSKYKKSSYLVNYRYSTIGLLEKLGVQLGDEVVNFQDLSVFLKFPMKKKGYVSMFGILGKSSNDFFGKKTNQQTDKEFQYIIFGQKTLITGLSYHKKLLSSWWLNSGAAFSTTRLRRDMDGTIDFRRSDYQLGLDRFCIRSSLSRNFTQLLKIELGSEFSHEQGEIRNRGYYLPNAQPYEFYGSSPSRTELRNYAQVAAPIGRKVMFLAGFRGIFDVEIGVDSNRFAIQPCVALDLKLNNKDKVSINIERSNQMSGLAQPANEPTIKGFDCWIFSANWQKFFGTKFKMSMGAFYQKFNSIQRNFYPNGLGFASMLDLTDNLPSQAFFSKGSAQLKGFEIRFSRPFSNGWFGELNGSLFDAKQKIRSTGEFVPTRFNSRWTSNFLAGKDWSKTFESGYTRTLGINMRVHARGGFWESPININGSQIEWRTVYSFNDPNSLRLPTYFRSDLRLFWKKNKKNRTGTLALDVQNVTNRLNVAWHYYDPFLEKIVAKTGLGLVPILSYRLEFQQKK